MNPSRSLRIALIVDPFSLRMKGGNHAPVLSAEWLGRGHEVRGFGAAPGAIPRSRIENLGGRDGLGVMAFKPDVVVVYDALSPAGWHGMRCARKLGVPLVAVEEGFSTRGSFLERRLRGIGESLWGRAVRRQTARVIALDQYAHDEAVRRGFDREIITVVPRGIDLEQFRPRLTSRLAQRHGAAGLSLLYLGPLDDDYHVETIIDAFASTVGQREDWALLIGADGIMRSTRVAQANRLGVGSRVHWLGKVRKEEVPGLMASSTLLVAPGGDRVLDGIQVRRALSCGLPVLAADLPRYQGLVDNGRNGLLVPAGDRTAWADAIRTAAGSPRRRMEWGLAAREFAESSLHWPRIATEIENLLIECVARAAAERESQGKDSSAVNASDRVSG